LPLGTSHKSAVIPAIHLAEIIEATDMGNGNQQFEIPKAAMQGGSRRRLWFHNAKPEAKDGANPNIDTGFETGYIRDNHHELAARFKNPPAFQEKVDRVGDMFQ
jgi:hypothetical protein